MKITGYQPTVQLNVGNAPKVQAAGDLNAFGGRGQGFAEVSQGLEQMAAVEQRKIEDDDATTASAAQLAYTQKMNDALYGDKGLLLTQQGGAKGVTQNLVDTERKIRDEVTQNYKFKTKKGVSVFDGLANRIASDRYELVRKHEYVEGEKEKDTVLNTSLYTNSEFAAKNYKDDALISNTLQTDDGLIATRYKDFGPEVVKAKQIEHRADALSKGLSAALTAEDYDRAEVLSYKYRDYIPSNKLSEATKFVTANRKKNNEITNNKSRYSKFGDDLDGALADIETNNMGDATATRKTIVQNMKHKIGTKYEIGGNGVDSTDCGKSVLDSWQEAGISFSSRYVPYMIDEAKEKGIWHEAGTYTPQPGDLVVVDGDNHVVMYGDNGGTIQAGVSRGKVYESNESPEKMFSGEVTGYISVPVEGKSASQIEEEKKSYISYYSQQHAIKTTVDSQEYANVSDSMLAAYKNGERDPNVFLNMAKQAAGSDYSKLLKYTEAADRMGKLSEGPTRSKSDTNTMLYLNRIISNATIDDIPAIRGTLYNSSNKLTQTDLISFDKQLNNLAQGKDDKAGAIADDNWKQVISNKDDQVNVLSVLNSEGVHGTDRYRRAMEIYDAGKANDRGIRDYAKTNNQERESIVNAWGDSGEKLVSLAEAGFRQGYTVDGQPFKWNGDYHPINTFISDIGTAMKTDPIAEQSLDYLMSNNIPLNPQNYSIVYNKLSEE